MKRGQMARGCEFDERFSDERCGGKDEINLWISATNLDGHNP
jgi:hypothetical protein